MKKAIIGGIAALVIIGGLASAGGSGSKAEAPAQAAPVVAQAAPAAPAPAPKVEAPKAAPKPAKANSLLCSTVKNLPVTAFAQAGALSGARGLVKESDPQAVRDAALAFDVVFTRDDAEQAAANQAFVNVLRANC